MLTDTEKYIIRQVAFKGAIELLPEHFKYDSEEGPNATQLVKAIEWLTEEFYKIITK